MNPNNISQLDYSPKRITPVLHQSQTDKQINNFPFTMSHHLSILRSPFSIF